MPRIPKPDGARRSSARRVGAQNLPVSGRQGRTPKWPLDAQPTDAIKRMWSEYWHSPQAVAWETVGCERAVAMLCQLEDSINNGCTIATVLTKHGQLQDRLGLTPKAMRAMLWEITDDAPRAAETSVMADYRAMLGKD